MMRMRSTRLQKIKRNGIYVVYGGERIWYRHPEQTILHLDESVYVRYDLADLKTVRLYDEQDRYFVYLEPCRFPAGIVFGNRTAAGIAAKSHRFTAGKTIEPECPWKIAGDF